MFDDQTRQQQAAGVAAASEAAREAVVGAEGAVADALRAVPPAGVAGARRELVRALRGAAEAAAGAHAGLARVATLCAAGGDDALGCLLAGLRAEGCRPLEAAQLLRAEVEEEGAAGE